MVLFLVCLTMLGGKWKVCVGSGGAQGAALLIGEGPRKGPAERLVHRPKFEQINYSLCKTTTYVAFTTLLISYPQSCALKMGKKPAFPHSHRKWLIRWRFSLTGNREKWSRKAVSGLDEAVLAARVVHRPKIEQTKEYPCKTTTCIRFTRLLMSYPQSCPQKMGTGASCSAIACKLLFLRAGSSQVGEEACCSA